mmetsp:Transcript_51293/g.76125  ORF Transcript_51293/g.76125 Transcript_51293/m.76125 type:complete len:102 (+) Transcript_51293:958-1263(+)
MSRNAPSMYLVPDVTRCPPCLTLPGRKVPCPTSIGITFSTPICSKYVPPPLYSALGVMANVMANIPLSIWTSVRGWEALYFNKLTEWARNTDGLLMMVGKR